MFITETICYAHRILWQRGYRNPPQASPKLTSYSGTRYFI